MISAKQAKYIGRYLMTRGKTLAAEAQVAGKKLYRKTAIQTDAAISRNPTRTRKIAVGAAVGALAVGHVSGQRFQKKVNRFSEGLKGTAPKNYRRPL
jgi:hypothetical protein